MSEGEPQLGVPPGNHAPASGVSASLLGGGAELEEMERIEAELRELEARMGSIQSPSNLRASPAKQNQRPPTSEPSSSVARVEDNVPEQDEGLPDDIPRSSPDPSELNLGDAALDAMQVLQAMQGNFVKRDTTAEPPRPDSSGAADARLASGQAEQHDGPATAASSILEASALLESLEALLGSAPGAKTQASVADPGSSDDSRGAPPPGADAAASLETAESVAHGPARSVGGEAVPERAVADEGDGTPSDHATGTSPRNAGAPSDGLDPNVSFCEQVVEQMADATELPNEFQSMDYASLSEEECKQTPSGASATEPKLASCRGAPAEDCRQFGGERDIICFDAATGELDQPARDAGLHFRASAGQGSTEKPVPSHVDCSSPLASMLPRGGTGPGEHVGMTPVVDATTVEPENDLGLGDSSLQGHLAGCEQTAGECDTKSDTQQACMEVSSIADAAEAGDTVSMMENGSGTAEKPLSAYEAASPVDATAAPPGIIPDGEMCGLPGGVAAAGVERQDDPCSGCAPMQLGPVDCDQLRVELDTAGDCRPQASESCFMDDAAAIRLPVNILAREEVASPTRRGDAPPRDASPASRSQGSEAEGAQLKGLERAQVSEQLPERVTSETSSTISEMKRGLDEPLLDEPLLFADMGRLARETPQPKRWDCAQFHAHVPERVTSEAFSNVVEMKRQLDEPLLVADTGRPAQEFEEPSAGLDASEESLAVVVGDVCSQPPMLGVVLRTEGEAQHHCPVGERVSSEASAEESGMIRELDEPVLLGETGTVADELEEASLGREACDESVASVVDDAISEHPVHSVALWTEGESQHQSPLPESVTCGGDELVNGLITGNCSSPVGMIVPAHGGTPAQSARDIECDWVVGALTTPRTPCRDVANRVSSGDTLSSPLNASDSIHLAPARVEPGIPAEGEEEAPLVREAVNAMAQNAPPAPEAVSPVAQSAPSVPEVVSPVAQSAPSVPEAVSPVAQSAPPVPVAVNAVAQSAPSVPVAVSAVAQSAPSVPVAVSPAAQSAPSVPEAVSPVAQSAPSVPGVGSVLPQNREAAFLVREAISGIGDGVVHASRQALMLSVALPLEDPTQQHNSKASPSGICGSETLSNSDARSGHRQHGRAEPAHGGVGALPTAVVCEADGCALETVQLSVDAPADDQAPAKKVTFALPSSPCDSGHGSTEKSCSPSSDAPCGPEALLAGGLFARASQRQTEFLRQQKEQEQQRREKKMAAEKEKMRRKVEEKRERRERLGMASRSTSGVLPVSAAAAARPTSAEGVMARANPRRPGVTGVGTGSAVRLRPIHEEPEETSRNDETVEDVAMQNVAMRRAEAGTPPSSAERSFQGLRVPGQLPALCKAGGPRGRTSGAGLPAHVARSMRSSTSLPALGTGAAEATDEQKTRVAQKMDYLRALSEQHEQLVASMSAQPKRPRHSQRLR